MGRPRGNTKNGHARIKLGMAGLRNPQAFGPCYTTFLLWSSAPEGQADNLAELPMKSNEAIASAGNKYSTAVQ